VDFILREVCVGRWGWLLAVLEYKNATSDVIILGAKNVAPKQYD